MKTKINIIQTIISIIFLVLAINNETDAQNQQVTNSCITNIEFLISDEGNIIENNTNGTLGFTTSGDVILANINIEDSSLKIIDIDISNIDNGSNDVCFTFTTNNGENWMFGA